MKRINERQVELTDLEREAYEHFNEQLDVGKDMLQADQIVRQNYPTLSEEFFQWLQ